MCIEPCEGMSVMEKGAAQARPRGGIDLVARWRYYCSHSLISSTDASLPEHFTAPSIAIAGVAMTPKRVMSLMPVIFSSSYSTSNSAAACLALAASF